MGSKSSKYIKLNASKKFVLRSFSSYDQTLHTYSSDGTSEKLSDTQEKIRQQCWNVCSQLVLQSQKLYAIFFYN